jgi:hypothetical protein
VVSFSDHYRNYNLEDNKMSEDNKGTTVSNPIKPVVMMPCRLNYLESVLSNIKEQVNGISLAKSKIDYDDAINELISMINTAT